MDENFLRPAAGPMKGPMSFERIRSERAKEPGSVFIRLEPAWSELNENRGGEEKI
jgi:hypothetical protein